MSTSSTCDAERSFLILRRLKTHLRNSQGQDRLNNLGILYAHRDVDSRLELEKEMEGFISRKQIRRNNF